MRDINIKKDKLIASVLTITVTAFCIAYCNIYDNKTTVKAPPVVTSYAETTVEETIIITSTIASEVTTLASENTTITSEAKTSVSENTTIPVSETTVTTEESITVSEEVVETLPITEVTCIEPEPIVEYIVYKPSTKYVHLSNCKWFNDECYEITDTEGIEARRCSVCNPDIEIINEYVEPETSSNDGLTYVKHFSRGTYYTGWGGGSGRTLIDCSYGNGEIKGSVASYYLWRTYGYNYNGQRTKIYVEVSGYPSMSGFYYLDDCSANYGYWAGSRWVDPDDVIDFYYYSNSNCQFQNQGVVQVDVYI